jgi:hypothetical protein
VLGPVLPALSGRLGPRPVVLDVAPSRALDGLLGEVGTVVRIDFDPAADGRLVDVRASLTAIPMRDACVELLVCSHLLEDVLDDHGALLQIGPVLSPTGVGVILVPIRPGPADEDRTASPEERVRRFGQADHVRYYGDDFTDRLSAAGLAWTESAAGQEVDRSTLSLISAIPDERFWLVGRARSGKPESASLADFAQRSFDERLALVARRGHSRPADGSPATAAAIGTLRVQLERAERRATIASNEAKRWQQAYTRLRSRRSVRVLAFGGWNLPQAPKRRRASRCLDSCRSAT